MVKRIYIKPSVVVVKAFVEKGILAGSPTDRDTDGPGLDGPGGPEDGRSKHFSYNAWNTWNDDC